MQDTNCNFSNEEGKLSNGKLYERKNKDFKFGGKCSIFLEYSVSISKSKFNKLDGKLIVSSEKLMDIRKSSNPVGKLSND